MLPYAKACDLWHQQISKLLTEDQDVKYSDQVTQESFRHQNPYLKPIK